MTSFAFVGCRTTRERNARGEGIGVYRVDAANGQWHPVQMLATAPNPSFLLVHPQNDRLYAIHGDLDLISAYRIDRESGELSPAGQRSTEGRNPVHLALDNAARWMVVPNYRTDTLASLPVSDVGELGSAAHVLPLTGTLGPHRVEQDYGRPHHAPFSPSGRWVVVPEKGFDQLVSVRLDPATGALSEEARIACRETSGPRHVAFHPASPFAFVVNELDSTVTSYRFDDETGTLGPLDIVSCLPRGFTGNSRASEIAILKSGSHVFASNRGHDSIAVFEVGNAGHLRSVDFVPTRGRTPRFFAFDPAEDYLYAANEDSDSIVQFRHVAPGRLEATGQVIATGSPTCIVFG